MYIALPQRGIAGTTFNASRPQGLVLARGDREGGDRGVINDCSSVPGAAHEADFVFTRLDDSLRHAREPKSVRCARVAVVVDLPRICETPEDAGAVIELQLAYGAVATAGAAVLGSRSDNQDSRLTAELERCRGADSVS